MNRDKPSLENTRLDAARRRVTDLRAALQVVSEIIASETTFERALQLVTPGIYMRYEVSVSVDNDGAYEVKVRSATHGTPVRITTMGKLSPGAAVAKTPCNPRGIG